MNRKPLAVRSLLLGMFFTFTVTGCSVKRPDTVFQDAQMENILFDYHIAKAMADDVPYNESYKKSLYMESVFQKHGVTEAEFDSSMVWFSRHPDVLTKIYENVSARLKKERDAINHLIALRDNKPKESLPGDSVNVWQGRKVYQLTSMPLDNRLDFTLSVDTNFKERDTLRWSVRFRFLETDSLFAPQMALQIVYDKDTLVSGPKKVINTGIHTLSLSADTLGAMKEIRGFIYNPVRGAAQHMLLDSITLMRYHATDTLKTDSVHVEPIVSAKKEDIAVKKVEPDVKIAPVHRPHRPRPIKKVE